MDCNDKEIFERLTALESTYNALLRRVEHIEELVESVQKMTVEIHHMRQELNGITEKVEHIEQRPARHWETVVSAVIGAIAGCLCTLIFSAFTGG